MLKLTFYPFYRFLPRNITLYWVGILELFGAENYQLWWEARLHLIKKKYGSIFQYGFAHLELFKRNVGKFFATLIYKYIISIIFTGYQYYSL